MSKFIKSIMSVLVLLTFVGNTQEYSYNKLENKEIVKNEGSEPMFDFKKFNV